ncbi:hypothetical protein [Bacteroides sp.]
MLKLKSIPLLYLRNGDILSYKYGNLFILNKDTYAVKNKIVLNLGWKEKYLSRIKLVHRLLRLGVRNAHQIDETTVLLFVNKHFYECDLENGDAVVGFIPPTGVRALNVVSVKGIAGFDDAVVFGGYLSNMNKEQVSVYKRIDSKIWEPVYTFKKGAINHIHNLIPDKDNECVWVLTGDFEHAAAIWKATDNFKKMELALSGGQSSRSCVAFPVGGKLLYATDTPFHPNSIRMLEKAGNGEWQSTKIMDIAGSCIYGCKAGDDFVFSTAVEPDGRDTGIFSLLAYRRGCGIVDRYSHLYVGTPEKGFREIYKVKKDLWFPGLFQFGTLRFPSGVNNTGVILAEHIATKKFDCKSMVIKLNN